MSNIKSLFNKEFKAYFNSPIAYIVIIVMLLMSGWFFVSSLFIANESAITSFVDVTPLLLVFFIPAITMRLFAEEVRMGTIEILATLPVKDYEIIISKYLAAAAVLLISVLLTLIYPLSLLLIGKLDAGEIFCSYLGIILLGSSFVAIGLFTSSLTKNQIIAFLLSFVICFVLFLAGKVLNVIPAGMVSLVEYAGVDSHFENIIKGVIDTRDIVYFSSIIVFFYCCTVYWMGSRRWR